MRFARLSDRLDAKNAQIVSRVIARKRRNKNAPVEMVAVVHPNRQAIEVNRPYRQIDFQKQKAPPDASGGALKLTN